MQSELHNAAARKNFGLSGESRAFIQLELARLRCEALMARLGRLDHLMAIHRQVGLAGYVTCEPFDSEHRRECRTLAARGLDEAPVAAGAPAPATSREPGATLAKMFADTIAASDALAAELAGHGVDDEQRDRLQLVHAHLMSACELLDERLTALELTSPGTDAAL